MMCQSNKLPPLPPAAVAVMLVVLLLFAHDGSGNDTVSVSGSLMVLVVEPGQLWASFTSIVCGPAARLPKVSPDTQAANRPPSLLQVYGPVPPEMVTVMLPSLPPLQLTSTFVELTTSASGSPIVFEVLPGQLWASFTSIVCGPAARLPKVSPDTQAANRPPSLLQVYGPVPPEMVTVMLPSLPPLQLTSVFVELTTSASGSPIVFEVLPGRLWACCTSIVCGLAARLPKVSPDTQAANLAAVVRPSAARERQRNVAITATITTAILLRGTNHQRIRLPNRLRSAARTIMGILHIDCVWKSSQTSEGVTRHAGRKQAAI